MDLYFDRGDRDNPAGHALVYFKVDTEPDKVYASYVVTLPIKSDLTKFLPPFLATHLGSLPLNDLSSFAMPPVPEPVDGFAELERLSRQRGRRPSLRRQHVLLRPAPNDGVGNGGRVKLRRALRRLGKSATVVGSEVSATEAEALTSAEEPEEELDASFNVNDVLFSFMSESDKLSELSRLLGRLRFAVEGADGPAAAEVGEEIAALARHLPEEFQVAQLARRGAGHLRAQFPAGQAVPGPVLPAFRRRNGTGRPSWKPRSAACRGSREQSNGRTTDPAGHTVRCTITFASAIFAALRLGAIVTLASLGLFGYLFSIQGRLTALETSVNGLQAADLPSRVSALEPQMSLISGLHQEWSTV